MTDLDVYLPLIQAGDTDAFGAWMAASETRIRLSLRSFAAVVDTEAVLQESLLRTWQVAPRCQPDGRADSLVRLAIRIARNLAISEARRHRANAPLQDDDGEYAYADSGAVEPDPLLRSAIDRCFGKLPGKPARALSMRLESGGGDPDAVLAERAGMTLNTFLQNFTRARKFLAACLQALGVDLEAVVT